VRSGEVEYQRRLGLERPSARTVSSAANLGVSSSNLPATGTRLVSALGGRMGPGPSGLTVRESPAAQTEQGGQETSRDGFRVAAEHAANHLLESGRSSSG